MVVIGVIQARLCSERLPGKVLMSLQDRSVLDFVVDSLKNAKCLDGIVIATSTKASDDAIATFAEARGVLCFRGPLEDVARRLLMAAEEQEATAIVRISGDSPLIDPVLVDRAVRLYGGRSVDVVTNVHPRTFPKGQSVEVIEISALRRAVDQMATAHHREHVTSYIYENEDVFVICSFMSEDPRPDVQLSIDTAEDLARCRAILAALPSPPWQAGWRACVAAYDAYALSTQ